MPERYDGSLDGTLHRIRSLVPSDLVERFRTATGLDASSFHRIQRERNHVVSGVDGSNGAVLEGGNFLIGAIRAGQSSLQIDGRSVRSLTPLRIVLVGPGGGGTEFTDLYRECFRKEPRTVLSGEDPREVLTVMRDTLEYSTALATVRASASGSMLLLDGSLRVTHASHDPVLQEILDEAAVRRVDVVAVAKRTAATWGGGFPLLPAVDGLARTGGISPPWWIRIGRELLDHVSYRQWQHGDIYVARLHEKGFTPFKLELPLNLPDSRVQKSMALLAGSSDDGRIPGYPFPLLDAHRLVTIDQAVVEQIRQDVVQGMARKGLTVAHYQQMFGDLHDEFDRY